MEGGKAGEGRRGKGGRRWRAVVALYDTGTCGCRRRDGCDGADAQRLGQGDGVAHVGVATRNSERQRAQPPRTSTGVSRHGSQ